MKRLPPSEILDFLRLVDEELRSDASLVVVGGAEIALGYAGWKHVTGDVEVTKTEGADLQRAWKAAFATSSTPLPLAYVAGIAVVPIDYESRLVEVLRNKLERLRIFVPERHDLAMMKIARGNEHDLAGLEELHATDPLDLEKLLIRYGETLPAITGRREDFDWAFLSAIRRLFSDPEFERARARIKKVPKEP